MSKTKKPAFDYSVKGFTSIPIDLLVIAEWNYKQEDKRKSNSLVGNFLRNGQVENVIVRQTGNKFEMTNGNHRLETAREILRLFENGEIEQFLEDHYIEPHSVEMIPDEEWNRPPVYFDAMGNLKINEQNPLIKGELYCFNLGEIPLKQAQRLAVETNETRFESDAMALAKLMEEISDEYGVENLVGTMPFTETELSGFAELSKFNWDQYEEPGSPDPVGDRPESPGLPGDDDHSPGETSIIISITCLREDEPSIRKILDKQIVSKFENVEIG